ncbi:SUN5 protein, partial [Fregetta grallaria]|nr:SUN5 protein [Fregetta grallaria]
IRARIWHEPFLVVESSLTCSLCFFSKGLDEEGKDETLLGTFTYAMQNEPTQTFPLQNGIPRAFWLLKLVIQSNWGKPGHTCIYRVQVHGKIVGTNAIGQTHV